MELQSLYSELEAIGVAVWAISGDDPERLRSFAADEGIEYEFLLDPDGAAFDAFGIRNETHKKTVPHPTVVVVDAAGTARYVVTDEDYKVRPPATEVVAAARRLVEGSESP